MKYDYVLVFTKKGNLLDYMNTDKGSRIIANVKKAKEYYGQERNIQLVASVRWEEFPVSTRKGIVQMPKCFCRIKCPVNPIPVKGEFELPSMESLLTFLKANGWEMKYKMNSNFFE